ncbi:MAG: lysylphosphatidylglycerol synthase transmembrane domain-containing protein, partial [Actinomycetota bacterium]
ALLVVQGAGSTGLATAAVAGLAVLVGALVLFGLTLRSDALAGRVGSWSGRVFSKLRRLARKPPIADWGPSFVRFRGDTVDLLRERWIPLTLATLVSHVSLYAVLLISLRHVGVSDAEVGWAEVLAAFAFVRLISALPITPGGLGVVELGLTAALVAAGGDEAEVVAAVLVYRAFTYLLPIPFGAMTYLAWRRGAERRRRAAEGDPAVTAAR